MLDSYKDKSEAMKDGGKMTNDRAVSERDRENEQGSREGSGEDEIVEEAVDFLQALLDLMTDLQLHLQVHSKQLIHMYMHLGTCMKVIWCVSGADQLHTETYIIVHKIEYKKGVCV